MKTYCEACGGKGWLLVSVDGYDAPPTMAFVEKCDECDRYADDFVAAEAYSNDGNGSILAVLVRHDG